MFTGDQLTKMSRFYKLSCSYIRGDNTSYLHVEQKFWHICIYIYIHTHTHICIYTHNMIPLLRWLSGKESARQQEMQETRV